MPIELPSKSRLRLQLAVFWANGKRATNENFFGFCFEKKCFR